VLAGDLVARAVSERALRWIAGLGFLAVGVWTLWRD
jgi:putative Ca2+/H+ antiporter (TMEM165/GDT1 family)